MIHIFKFLVHIVIVLTSLPLFFTLIIIGLIYWDIDYLGAYFAFLSNLQQIK
jgi:hypothetical protein